MPVGIAKACHVEQIERLRQGRSDDELTRDKGITCSGAGQPKVGVACELRDFLRVGDLQIFGQKLRDIRHALQPAVAGIAFWIGILRKVVEPLFQNSGFEPGIHISLHAGIAHREILCAVVEATPRHASRRHAPSEAAPFVKHTDGQSRFVEFCRTQQARNARLLTDPGAALLVREGANAPQQVADHISALLAAPDALADMAAKARASALLGAADKLADMVEQEIATP